MISSQTGGDVKGKQGSDVLTIWAQAYHTYHQLNEQRGSLPHFRISCLSVVEQKERNEEER